MPGSARRFLTKRSDIDALIDGLCAAGEVDREAAVARLRVVGSRAVPRLAALAAAAPAAAARAAALRALDGIDDQRAIGPAVGALADADADVALAAVGVLRGWLQREPGTRALDALAAVALDRGRDGRLRRAALDALSDLPRDLVQPVLDQSGELWGQTPVTSRPAASPRAAPVDDPGAVREWLSRHAADAPLSALHDIVVQSGARERVETSPHRRGEWLAVRGAAHAALARRGSRVAAYDLRDAFQSGAPLPLDFLTAVTSIGDASCLEPMARGWEASPHEPWWRDHLQAAAAAIVHRTRLSGRSAAIKRIRVKWPGFL